MCTLDVPCGSFVLSFFFFMGTTNTDQALLRIRNGGERVSSPETSPYVTAHSPLFFMEESGTSLKKQAV